LLLLDQASDEKPEKGWCALSDGGNSAQVPANGYPLVCRGQASRVWRAQAWKMARLKRAVPCGIHAGCQASDLKRVIGTTLFDRPGSSSEYLSDLCLNVSSLGSAA